ERWMLTSLPASPSVSSLLQRRRDPLSVCAVIIIFRHSQTPSYLKSAPAPGGGGSLEMSAQVTAQ
ncbi:hypothetical protein NDU88_007904, partial [Pleurodeles waltl]